jgi:DNA-binding response OmpR family regulator
MTSPNAQRSEPLPDDAPHVLIVDDDHKIRDLLARYLFTQGFRVTTAGDAETAQASLRGLEFDIVLLDVMMPGISGLELAREIKKSRDIPICMLTARAEPEQRIEGLEIGVDDYVPKPFEPRELLLRLRMVERALAASIAVVTRKPLSWRKRASRSRMRLSSSTMRICGALSSGLPLRALIGVGTVILPRRPP